MKQLSNSRISLRMKLIVTMVALVVIPLLIIGVISGFQFRLFSDDTASMAYDALRNQAFQTLDAGVTSDRGVIRSVLSRASLDTLKLAASSNLKNYIQSLQGHNEILNTFAKRESERIIEGILRTCQAHQGLLEKKLMITLNLAEQLIAVNHGRLQFSEWEYTWQAENQYTHETITVKLPLFESTKNNLLLKPVMTFDRTCPIVDDVTQLAGGTCTIFQRINDQGDMLRVLTNVKRNDGTRAIGTYIPAVNPDGNPNPVISTIMSGKIFIGKAYVVNDWYITIYKPLYNKSNELIGMLYYGINEKQTEDLIQSIMETSIGKSGYLFVIDSKGIIVVHPDTSLQGKPVSTIIDAKTAQTLTESSDADGQTIHLLPIQLNKRDGFVVYAYFQQWDWILCGIGFWEEFSETAAYVYKEMLKEEIINLWNLSEMDTEEGSHKVYSSIRYINGNGEAVIALNQGKFETDLRSLAPPVWFEHCRQIPSETVSNEGVEHLKQYGQPIVRFYTPVYVNDHFHGAIVTFFNWDIVQKLLSHPKYGKSGFPFIVNEAGQVITLPPSTSKHQAFLKHGIGSIVGESLSGQMKTGHTGHGSYRLDNTDYFIAFKPLIVGQKIYSIAGTGPASEFLKVAEEIKETAEEQIRNYTAMLVLTLFILIFLGCFIGLSAGNKLSQRLSMAIKELSKSAENITQVSRSVSLTSHSTATGTAVQAEFLDNTSKALGELSEMTRKYARHAREVNTLMKSSEEMFNNANSTMVKLTLAMNKINKASKKTSKIVQTIDDIAFQTNLLALNAAVEAARAGEAGTGFAIVASEVRNLAIKTAEAAKSTSEMIDETIQRISDGAELVTDTDDAFTRVAKGNDRIGQLFGEIAATSHDQAIRIERINKAVAEISQIIRQNATDAEASATAAQQMHNQAKQIDRIVGILVEIVGGKVLSGLALSDQKSAQLESTPQLESTEVHESPDEASSMITDHQESSPELWDTIPTEQGLPVDENGPVEDDMPENGLETEVQNNDDEKEKHPVKGNSGSRSTENHIDSKTDDE